MINNTRNLNVVVGWKIITTLIHKNTEPIISANTFQYLFWNMLKYYGSYYFPTSYNV